MKYICNWLCH